MFETEFNQYLVKPNHACYLPNEMLFFDSETKQRVVGKEVHHRMRLSWTCYFMRRRYRKNDTVVWNFWENTIDFNKYILQLTKDKRRLWLFGHNVFFDLQCSDFFFYFTHWGWSLNFFYDKNMTYILSLSRGKRKITVLSTTNFFPYPLKDLGKLVGIKKLDIDLEKADFETLKKYCKQDVEIIKAAIERYLDFISDNDLGAFKMTRAAQALAAYRHRFMDKPILVHRNKEVTEFERLAYHGGRVECYRIGEIRGGPFVSLDVNSMYPYVMSAHSYPVKLLATYEYPSMALLKEVLKWRSVVAECYVTTNDPAYATVRDMRVIFPIGSFKTYLCTQGVKYALEHGHLVSVARLAVYQSDRIFNSYVKFVDDLKTRYGREKNKIMTRLAKDLGVCLYGKWAQEVPIEHETEDLTFDGYYREEVFDSVTGKVEIVTKLFNKQIVQFDTKPARNSMVAISAHVTEYARFHLWEIIKSVGRNRVLYCDTDSIKIRKKDLRHVKNRLDEYELGALKKEEVSRRLILYGPKDYETDKSIKIKGIPKEHTITKEGKFKYMNFPRQATHLKQGVDRYYITEPIEKRLTRIYTKGNVSKDGKVTPITLEEPCPPF